MLTTRLKKTSVSKTALSAHDSMKAKQEKMKTEALQHQNLMMNDFFKQAQECIFFRVQAA